MKTNRDKLQIRQKGTQKGLFLSEGSFNANSILFTLDYENVSSERTRTSIEIHKNGLHCEDTLGMYMNHSFNPSCKIEGFAVVTLKDLQPGDEITFNYIETETEISHPFVDKDTQEKVGGEFLESV